MSLTPYPTLRLKLTPAPALQVRVLPAIPVVQANYGTTAGTVAQGNDTRITGALQKSANLSDLVDASAARAALSLGTAALKNVGTAANNVVQLDGSAKLPAVDASQLLHVPSSLGIFNVKDYGAVADGATDDTTAIVNCIAAAVAATTSYQPTLTVTGSFLAAMPVVWFPPGKYKITTTIALPSALRIMAYGAVFLDSGFSVASTYFKATSTLGTGPFNGRYFYLEGGQFDMTAHNSTAIDIYNGNIGGNIHLRRVGFWGGNPAMKLKCESSYILIEECDVAQAFQALHTINATSGGIAQIWIRGGTWTAAPPNGTTISYMMNFEGFYTDAINHGGDIVIIEKTFFGTVGAPSGTTGAFIINNNTESLTIRDVRFSQETGGMCAVDNFTSWRDAQTAPATRILLDNCELFADWPAADRCAGIRLYQITNQTILRNCKTPQGKLIEWAPSGSGAVAALGGGTPATTDQVMVDVGDNYSKFSGTTPVTDQVPVELLPYHRGLKPVTARAHLAGAQALVGSTDTKVNLDTADFDADGLYNSTQKGFVIKAPGQYRINGNATTAATGAVNQNLVASIGVNGSSVRFGTRTYGPAASEQLLSTVTDIINLSVGDVVTLHATRDANDNLSVGSGVTYLSIDGPYR